MIFHVVVVLPACSSGASSGLIKKPFAILAQVVQICE
jgi:hypothetical protein